MTAPRQTGSSEPLDGTRRQQELLANRSVLKRLFRAGALPSERDFAALIDAFVHRDELQGWTEHGTVTIGDPRETRWTLRTDANGALIVTPVQTDDRRATMQVQRWIGVPGRIGTFPLGELQATNAQEPRASTDGARPFGVHKVHSDGSWHPLVAGVAIPAAFELVARLSFSATNVERGALWRRIGFGAPLSTVLHAVAVSSGFGECPALHVTTAPIRPPRRWWVIGATTLALLAICMVVYAAFSFPAIGCPVPWGASCVHTLVKERGGEMTAAGIVALVSIAITALLVLTHRHRTQLAWRRRRDGAYDLCARSAAREHSIIECHITRLW